MKQIKSSLREENMDLYLQYRDDIFHAINEVDKKYNMSGVGPFSTKKDFDEVIEWMDIHDYWAEPDEYDEIESSRRPIKSDYHLEPGEMKAYQITNYDVHYGRKDDYFLYNIKDEYSPDRPDELIDLIKNQLKYHKKIYRLEFGTGEIFDVEYDENMEPRLIPANKITSSMQGQERGIQAIMDEYGCTREEAIDIMNEGITSGCHGKTKKKDKKEIKSSPETWETGYQAYYDGESYADYPTGLSNSEAEDWMSGYDYANREDKGELTEAEEQVWSEDDEERLRGRFADERGLNLNEDEFPEDEYEEWVYQGAAMYSSVTRNHRNIKALYN